MLCHIRLLFIVTFAIIELSSIASALGVTSIVCPDRTVKGCINNSEINISGHDLNFECDSEFLDLNKETWIDVNFKPSDCNETFLLGRLHLLSLEYCEGCYAYAIQSKQNQNFYYQGTLMLGSFNGIDVPQYLDQPPPTDVNISRLASDTISEGCNLTLYGVFDPNHAFYILFYCANANIVCDVLPRCKEVFATKYMLTCEIEKALVNDIKYYFIVQDMQTKLYVHITCADNTISAVHNSLSCFMGPTAPPPPPPSLPILPYIINATGECVSKSSYCVNDSTITFTGGTFDKDKMNRQVNIEGMKSAACVISDVNRTSLICKLSGIDKDAKGTYPMTLETNMSYGNLNDVKIRMGTLVLGEGNVNGHTLDFIVNKNMSFTYTKSSHVKKVTTALAVVFAILFRLALASLVFMSFNYRIVPRKVWSSISTQLGASNSSNNNDRSNNNDNVNIEQNEPINV